ncbi:MAG: pilus assembly protein PilO [Scytolyngbya sp. HA4215-MV1]|jgi:type IV pilus assembly protein PilO|nr:pilus assembly protein PilO [Scytolyngbya sp. HA4215-MV1]
MTRDFIPDPEFESPPEYPTVFGITLTPMVSGVLLALVGIGGAVWLVLNAVLPALETNQQLSASVASKESEIANQAENIKKIEQVKKDLSAAKQRKQEVLSLFSDEKTLDTLLLDLNQLIKKRNAGVVAATRSKLNTCPAWVKAQFVNLKTSQDFEEKVGPLIAKADLQKYEPDEKTSGNIVDGSLGSSLNNKLKRKVVNVEFQGNFSQTQAILRDIERLQPLLIISDLKGTLGQKQSGSGSSSIGGLYQIEPGGQVRFLTNCQPEPLITTSFKLQALLPLSEAEAAAAAPTPAPSPK